MTSMKAEFKYLILQAYAFENEVELVGWEEFKEWYENDSLKKVRGDVSELATMHTLR